MKRVLFDEDMPRQLRQDLREYSVQTVQEAGWAGVKNGELLRRASEQFDVFITADQRLQYQQNIPRFNIGVVVIEALDTRLPNLRRLLSELKQAIEDVRPGSARVVKQTRNSRPTA